jgi:guanosine-3',5'-bis(diphosphate) 3'-pyrophosphohydrolase
MTLLSVYTKACEFASQKHLFQRRKGVKDIPYINHPLEVANLLSHSNEEDDLELLIAAVLHDVVEDTDTTPEELTQLFGAKIANLVLEVTDDMKLTKKERRSNQVIHAPSLSGRAKQIKIADKTCNVLDIISTRLEWTITMKIDYIQWAMQVVNACRGVNTSLEAEFDKAVQLAKQVLGEF